MPIRPTDVILQDAHDLNIRACEYCSSYNELFYKMNCRGINYFENNIVCPYYKSAREESLNMLEYVIDERKKEIEEQKAKERAKLSARRERLRKLAKRRRAFARKIAQEVVKIIRKEN